MTEAVHRYTRELLVPCNTSFLSPSIKNGQRHQLRQQQQQSHVHDTSPKRIVHVAESTVLDRKEEPLFKLQLMVDSL